MLQSDLININLCAGTNKRMSKFLLHVSVTIENSLQEAYGHKQSPEYAYFLLFRNPCVTCLLFNHLPLYKMIDVLISYTYNSLEFYHTR